MDTLADSCIGTKRRHVSCPLQPVRNPAGQYTLHVLLNGQEVQSKTFTVQQ